MDVFAEMRRVVDVERQALERLHESMGPAYEEAGRWLYACSGTVILTGVGKSGIIAQKIAATMISTGTPATFLHGAEAMHGDVGVIRKHDVMLAISKSGESEELLTILPVVRSLGAKIISITAQPTSTLARDSDLVLHTPIEEEACPLNMAPTSSTTAALVVGDALAMTLMKLRNFKPDDFALNHPGGQLGKRLLLNVRDVMRSGTDNPIIRLQTSPRHMLYEITNKRAGAVSVADDAGHLVGLVTDYDVRRALESGRDFFSLTVQEIMNPNPECVYDDQKAFFALERMEKREKPISVLPVLNRQEAVVGMVHLHDLVVRGLR